MLKINIQEAKAHFSRYLDQVENGETVVICRHNQPIAELRAIHHTAVPRPRVAGLLKGLIRFEPSSFAPMTGQELADFDTSQLLPEPQQP